MELQDTIELMNSSDYKDRFKAEYWQAKIRYDKLDDMTVKYEARTLTFIPRCSLDLLKEQKSKELNYRYRCERTHAPLILFYERG